MKAYEMVPIEILETSELERIDFGIRVNYWLVQDGRHPAVDFEAVWAHINSLLERRLELTRGTL